MIEENIQIDDYLQHLSSILCSDCNGEKIVKTTSKNGERMAPCFACNGHGILLQIPLIASKSGKE